VHGLCTALALAFSAIPQLLVLIQAPSHMVFKKHEVSARASAMSLVSAGSSGVSLGLFFGSADCAGTFFYLAIAVLFVSALFGYGWYKGEAGGIMGLVQKGTFSGS